MCAMDVRPLPPGTPVPGYSTLASPSQLQTQTQGQTHGQQPAPPGNPLGQNLLGDEALAHLLEGMGFRADRVHLEGARLLFFQVGSVDPKALSEFARLDAVFKNSSDRAAAAFLLARGLPATHAAVAQVIASMAARANDNRSLGRRLADRLAQIRRDFPTGLSVLGSAGEALEGLWNFEDLSGGSEALTDKLIRLAKALNPVEAEVAAFLVGSGGDLPDRTAGNLLCEIERAGPDQRALQDLAGEIRFQLLGNARSAGAPVSEVHLPLVFDGQTGELFVGRYRGKDGEFTGPTRVVVAFDWVHLGHVEVDLIYHNGQVGGKLKVDDQDVRDYLADRLADLRSGLGRVGVGVSHLDVSSAKMPTDPGHLSGHLDITT